MTRRHKRRTFVGLLVAVALGTALVSGVVRGSGDAQANAEAEFPTALGRHLATLKEALPGNQGMAEDGPSSAAEGEFLERAYPADTISVEQMDAARAAFTATKGRPFPTGKGRKGTWVTVGPSQALYPSSQFLNSFLYVPNAYLAGGRTTSIALAASCKPGNCRAYITAAGGGVWRTKNALTGEPQWEYLGGRLGINAAGSVYLDPNDPSGNTVYAGTGEANICGSGCVAGTGLYKSTDGGDTWSGPLGGSTFDGLGIGAIVVKPGSPNTLYLGVTTALRGMSSVCCTGVTRPVPGAGKWGSYKSTDGGATWSFIHNGSTNVADCVGDLTEWNNGRTCSPRGVRALALDPSNPEIVYASSYARGVWRSPDGGATWTQIKPSLNAAVIQTRASIAVAALPTGKTRMYVYEGNAGQNASRLFRSDDVASGAPVFTDMSSASTADPGWAWRGICDPQCWYDEFVYTPQGYPDIVYAGGDYSYGETVANKRGVILSTDAGVSGTDMTFDGTDMLHPNGLHPDQHAIVTVPGNPFQFIEANDGGVMRSSGEFVDRSSWCDDPNRGLSGASLGRCRQMLSRIPSELKSLNKGLSTLQFQSLSVSPHNANVLQGGTQDNGTWESDGNPVKWENKMIGDGGQSGFDVAIPGFRMHNFTGASPDVNFNKGNIADWIWTGDPLAARRRVLRPRDHRPGGVQDDVRRYRANGVQDEDGWPRIEDDRRGTGRLQRVDRVVLGCLRRLGRARPDAAHGGRVGHAGRRQRCTGRAHRGRHIVGVGSDDNGPRVRLEERRRRSGGRGLVDADRRRLCNLTEPLRQQHLCRLGKREPRVDLVQRVQREYAGDAGPRVRGDLRPDRGDVDLGRSVVRHAGHPGNGPRPRRRDRQPLRRERLRRLAPGSGRDELGRGGIRDAERGGRGTDDRAWRTDSLRRHARSQRLAP